MCGNPEKRSSFWIDDILTNNNNKIETKIDKDKLNNNAFNNKIKNNDKEEYNVTLKIKENINIKTDLCNKELERLQDDSILLRNTLLNKEDNFNFNRINKNCNSINAYPQDLSKSSELERQRNLLDHNERTSAFKGVFDSCASSRSLVTSGYSVPKFGYPGNGPYADPFGTPFGTGVPAQTSHWPLLPSLYNYTSATHGHHAGYSPYLPSSYFRPYALPLSLSFPLPYSKRKGGQVRFTPQQTQNLERRFGSHQYLSPEDRRILADQLKLTDRQVKTWFQNRRAKWRRTKNVSSSDCQDEGETHTDDEESSESNESSMFRSPRNSPISVG